MEKKHLLFSLAFASAATASAQGIDLTGWINNPGCESKSGWTLTGNAQNMSTKNPGVTGISLEAWRGNANGLWVDYYQSTPLTLQPGKYTLSAKVAHAQPDNASSIGKKEIGLYAKIGNTYYKELVPITNEDAVDNAKKNTYSVEFEVTEKDTKVSIGVKNFEAMTAHWFVMDDFTLILDYAFDAEQCSFELQKAISVIGGYDKTKKDFLDEAAELQSDITKLGQKDYDTYLKYIESYNKLDEAIKAKIADLAARARTAEANAVLPEIWAAYEKFTSAKSNAQTLINTYKYDKAVYQARLNAVQYAESNLTDYGSKDGVVADENIVDAWKDIVAAIEAQTAKIAPITADGDAAQKAQGSADDKAVASVNSAISALNTAADVLQSNINKATIDGVCGTFSTDAIKAEIASVFVVKNEIGAATEWPESKVNTEKAKIQAKITKMQDELDKAIANHEAYTEVKKAYDAAIATYNTAVAAITESINSDHFAEDKTVAQGELRTQRTNLNTALAALNKAHEGGTMVAEKEAITNSINAAKAALEASQKNWTEKVAGYKAAYDAKNATIAALSYDENADKDVADFTRVKNAKAAIPAAISAMQEKLDDVKGKEAVLTLDLTADVEAANTLISTYTTAIADAKAAVEANKAALEDIAAIEKAINDQKTATSALQSEDKAFTVGTKCDAEFTDLTNNKTAANTALATAFAAEKAGTKPVGSTATQQASVASLKSDVNTKLADINQRAADAVAKYNELQAEVAGYQARLAELKKAVEGLNIYEATGYNYKGQIEALNARVAAEAQKLTKAIANARINDWKENVGGTVVTRRGVLYNLNAITIDAKITGDIKTLEDGYEPAEAGYKAHVAYESCKTMYDEAKARIDAYQANEMADFAEKHKPVADEVGIAAAALNSQYEAIVAMVKKLSADGLNPVSEGTDGSLAANTEKIAQLSTVRDEINKVEEAVTALDNAVAAAKQALADNVAKKAAADASISTLNSTLAAVKSNNSTVTGYYAAQKTAIAGDIATLTSDIAASNTAQSLVNDYKDVKDKDGKVTKKGFETRINELTAAIAALKDDVAKADSYYAQIYPTTGTTVTKAYNDLKKDANYTAEKALLDLTDVDAKVAAAKTALEVNAKAGTVVENQVAITTAITSANTAISNLKAKAAEVHKNHVAHDAIANALTTLNSKAETVKKACGASYDNADKWKEVVEAAQKYAADNNPGEFKVDDKCAAAQSGINTAVAEHTANLNKVEAAAADNATNKAALLEKYNDMDAAWYAEYEAIKTAFADQPTVLADAEKEFEALQSDMFDISADIEKAYKAGELTDKYEQGVSQVGTIEGTISAKKQAITDLRNQYNGTYSEAIAKVNADNKAEIQAKIDEAKDAYTEAINTLNALKLVKNAAWAADIKAEVEAANETLYPIALKIRANESDLNGVTLKDNEYLLGSADAKVEDSKWYLSAAESLNTVTGAIEDLLDVLNPKAGTAYSAAYGAASDLLKDAKKMVIDYIDVTDAFKDVEDLLAEQADMFDKAESKCQCVVYDEIAEALDADKVQDMLDADLQKAAQKEYEAWIQTYDKANTGIYQKAQAKVTTIKVGSFSAAANAALQAVYDKYITAANAEVQKEGLVDALPDIKKNIADNFANELNAIVEKAQADYVAAVADKDNTEAAGRIETAKNNAQAAIDGLPYNPDMVSEDDAALIEAAIQAQQEKLDGLTYPADKAVDNETSIKNACTAIVNAVNGVKGKDGKYTGGIKQQIEDAENYFIANDLKAQKELYLSTEYKTLVDKYNQIAADFTVDVKVVDAYDKEIKALKAAIEGAESIEALKALNDDIVDLNARMDGTIHADEIASMRETLNTTIAGLEDAAKISIEGIEANIYTDGVTYQEALDDLNEGVAALKADVAAADNKLYYFNDEYTQTADELAEKAEKLAAAAAKAIANETAWAAIDSDWKTFINETIPAAKDEVKNNCPDVYEDYDYRYINTTGWAQKYYNEMNSIHGQGGLNAASVETTKSRLEELQWNLDEIAKEANADQLYVDNEKALTSVSNSRKELNELLNNAKAVIDEYADAVKAQYTGADITKNIQKLYSDAYNESFNKTLAANMYNYEERINGIKAEIEKLAADAKVAQEEYLANTYEKGDISHDGKITTTDYSAVLSLALGEEVDGVEEGSAAWKAADINDDDEIDIADVVGVVNLWKGLKADGSAKVKMIKSMMKDTSKDGISIMNLGNGMFAVSLDNVNEYVGFQLDIQMPEGLQIVESNLAERAANHNVATSMLADGTLRVIVSSTDNLALEGNSGNIVIFRAESDGTFGGGEIVVSGKFADSNAYAHVLGAAAAAGDEATGITANNIVVRSMYKIYNAGGVLVDKLQKGINILVGEDGSSKKVMVK